MSLRGVFQVTQSCPAVDVSPLDGERATVDVLPPGLGRQIPCPVAVRVNRTIWNPRTRVWQQGRTRHSGSSSRFRSRCNARSCSSSCRRRGSICSPSRFRTSTSPILLGTIVPTRSSCMRASRSGRTQGWSVRFAGTRRRRRSSSWRRHRTKRGADPLEERTPTSKNGSGSRSSMASFAISVALDRPCSRHRLPGWWSHPLSITPPPPKGPERRRRCLRLLRPRGAVAGTSDSRAPPQPRSSSSRSSGAPGCSGRRA